MAGKTSLTETYINRIADLVKMRIPWKYIAQTIGVHVDTLRNWRDAAAAPDADGLFLKLGRAIEEAEAEAYQALADVVTAAATEGQATLTETTTKHPDGSVTEVKQIKMVPPNATLAKTLMDTLNGETHAEDVDTESLAKGRAIREIMRIEDYFPDDDDTEDEAQVASN